MVKSRIVAGALAGVLCAGYAWAQESKPVTVGPEYAAGALKRVVFGDGYRDLWTTPVRLPVLDLKNEAGGLTPVRQVGQAQSLGLAMKGADGRAYTFRSLHKEPQRMMPEQVRDTWVGAIAHDQTSGTHPAAGVMLPVFAGTLGIAHTTPRLVVMPDDPALGEFRATFANQIGTIEEFPTPTSSTYGGFMGATEIVSSGTLWKRLLENPRIRVDSRQLLRARIMDLWVENFDRHRGQWRWMTLPGQPGWQPLPEDPDFVFLYRDGLLMRFLHAHRPQFLKLEAKYQKRLEGPLGNSFEVDRWLLADLTAEDFASIAREVQAALTDDVIDRALRQMPPEWYAKDAPRKLPVLQSRRAALVDYVGRVYRYYAKDVDVHASDLADEVSIARGDDDSVDVTIAVRGEAPYFRRRFVTGETGNVRVYLHGGDDRVVRTGRPGGPVLVRVITGSGHDVVDDSASGGTEVWHDAGTADVRRGPGTDVVGQRWVNPSPVKDAPFIEPRSFGHWTTPGAIFSYSPDTQFVLGYGFSRTAWGFRTLPAKSVQSVGAAIATGGLIGRLQYTGEFNRAGSHLGFDIATFASTMEHYHYFGPGNETEEPAGREAFQTRERVLSVTPGLRYEWGPRLRVTAGADVRYSRTEDREGSILSELNPYGAGAFSRAAVRGTFLFDSRAPSRKASGLDAILPTDDGEHVNGVRVSAEAFHAPKVWDVKDAYSGGEGSLAAYVGRPRAHMAFRVGGRKLWGEYPWFESAFIGGRNDRGFADRRFAGDASLYGSASFRGWLGDLTIAQIPLRIGALAFTDTGRVWLAGEASNRWHTSTGGGLMVRPPGVNLTAYAVVARSTEGYRFYAGIGYPF